MNKFKKAVSITTMFVTVLSSLPLGTMNMANAAISQVSRLAGGVAVATNPATGFPVWYQDVAGVALQHCLGTDVNNIGTVDPKCILPGFTTIPNINANPATFPDESFYYFAEAPLDINGSAGRFRLLIEAAFANAAPVIGDQTVFARASLFTSQAGALPLSGTFHAVYPFGSFDFTTDATGGIIASSPTAPFQPNGGNAKEIRAEDGLLGPLDFTSVLTGTNTGITTFLRSITAPAGYLGDAVSATPVTGGTNGNAFILTGSGVDALGNPVSVNINQPNWVVAGKIAIIDTVTPTIVSVTPAELTVNAAGQVPAGTILSANVTDDLGVRSATIDLSVFGTSLNATLNGAQSVPPTGSPATGTGTFTIDTAANTLTFNVNATGLTGGTIDSIHIHGPAIAGASAPMLFDMGTTLPAIGVWNYLEANEADILAGRTYVNIHTALFADLGDGAEIRGQILPVSDIRNMQPIGILPSTNATFRIFLPAINQTGTFNLPITATDGSNIAALNFVLSVVNPVPVAVADTATIGTGIGESATISVLANDTDPNGNIPLSLLSVQNVSIGTGVVSGNNVVITSPTNIFAGTITAQYTVADSLGATSVGDITVNVVRDVTAPVITVLGTNPIAVRLGSVYTDAGATALDDFDGNVTANIQTTNPVNTAIAGQYNVTYSVSDAVGNIASATRIVNVEAPVLTSIVLTPNPLLVPLAGNRQLTAQARDQFGTALSTQPIFTWSSNNQAVASVSASGSVSGVSLGQAIITAASGLVSGTSNATVTAGPVCETTADADLSGTISNLEVLNHVRSWKAGTVPNLEILNAIRFWKSGIGC